MSVCLTFDVCQPLIWGVTAGQRELRC